MARPRKMDHLIQHGMDDEVLVYDPVVDRTHRLNVSATLIWELCDGTRSLEDIARVLTEQFEVEFETAMPTIATKIVRRTDLSISIPSMHAR